MGCLRYAQLKTRGRHYCMEISRSAPPRGNQTGRMNPSQRRCPNNDTEESVTAELRFRALEVTSRATRDDPGVPLVGPWRVMELVTGEAL